MNISALYSRQFSLILFRSMSHWLHLGPRMSSSLAAILSEPQITFFNLGEMHRHKIKNPCQTHIIRNRNRAVCAKPHWDRFVLQKRNRNVYTGVRYNKLSSGSGGGSGSRTTKISIPADGDDLLEPIVNNSEDEDDDEDDDDENGKGQGEKGDHVYHDDDHELHDGAMVTSSSTRNSGAGHSRQNRFVATGHHGASRRGTRPQPDSIRFART